MLASEIAESFALTDSINRAIGLRRRMLACSDRLDSLEALLSGACTAADSEQLRRTRLEAVEIGRALLTAYDEIAAINFRRAYQGRELGT